MECLRSSQVISSFDYLKTLLRQVLTILRVWPGLIVLAFQRNDYPKPNGHGRIWDKKEPGAVMIWYRAEMKSQLSNFGVKDISQSVPQEVKSKDGQHYG